MDLVFMSLVEYMERYKKGKKVIIKCFNHLHR